MDYKNIKQIGEKMSKLLDCLRVTSIYAGSGAATGVITSIDAIINTATIYAREGAFSGILGSAVALTDHYITQNITSNKPIQYITTTALGVSAWFIFLSVFNNPNDYKKFLFDYTKFDNRSIAVKTFTFITVGSALYLKYKWDGETDDITDMDNTDALNASDTLGIEHSAL